MTNSLFLTFIIKFLDEKHKKTKFPKKNLIILAAISGTLALISILISVLFAYALWIDNTLFG